MKETPTQWSLRTWKARHEQGYFPNSEEHREWKVYDAIPEWLAKYGRFTSGDTVLEIGCGYGEWMIPLSPIVKRVVGVDVHPSPLTKGESLCSELRVENVFFDLSDGVSLTFEDDQFSRVYSISVFQHLPRSIVCGYLKESVRVVTGDGLILHHFRNADNVGPYPPLAKDISVNHTGDFSVGWTKSEIEDAAVEAGMKDISVIDLGMFLLLVGNK